MSRIIMWNMLTLDGFFEGQKPWDLDWHEYTWGTELEQFSLEQLAVADMLIFGRKTYEGMADYWPKETGEIADIMNSIPKLVFSKTLDRAAWNNTRLSRNAEEEVAALKKRPGRNMFIFGSANLSASLSKHGLIDEYRLGINPVALGSGNPLFKAAPDRLRLRLLQARTLNSGCVLLFYEPLQAAD